MLAGHVTTGGRVSLTVTVKVHEPGLPLASVAVQVTGVVPLAKVEPLAGLQATVAPGQLSVTLAANVTTAPHWFTPAGTLMLAGQVTAGGCVSLTVTVKVHELVVPLLSVPVQVTGVVPLAKVEPLVGLQATVAPGQLSVMLAANVTTALHWSTPAGTLMLAGQVTAGGCVSLTVTVKVHALVLPLPSVPVQVTGVVPLAKVEPLAGLQATVAPGQLSVTLAANVTAALHWFGTTGTLILAGQVTAGGCVSLTVTVKVHELVLPLPSVAMQVTVVVPLAKVEPLAGLQAMLAPGELSLTVAV
jgi:hypothetical protein